MKVLIDLSHDDLKKIQKLADADQRSRKQMIELIIQRGIK